MLRLKPAIKEANRVVWKGIVCLCFSSARIQTRFPKAALTGVRLKRHLCRGCWYMLFHQRKETKLENWNLWSERKAQMTQTSDNNVFFHACFSISTTLLFLWRISKQFWNGGGLLEATGERGKLHSHNNPVVTFLDSPTWRSSCQIPPPDHAASSHS